jgi:hypothetical protein
MTEGLHATHGDTVRSEADGAACAAPGVQHGQGEPTPPASPFPPTPPALPPLAIARYRFTAVFERDLPLPEYAGPLLRSVFGLALKRGVCTTGAAECAPCPLYRQCAYPAILRTPARETPLAQGFSDVPNPYVIEPPALGTVLVRGGQPLHWHQVLIGSATLRRLPLIVGAWERALRSGWGPQRVRGRLVAVACVDAQGRAEAVLDAAAGRLRPHEALLTPPDMPGAAAPATQGPGELHLDFDTPLRIQRDGRPLRPAELSPRALVSQMLRRFNLVLDLHLGIRPPPYDVQALLTCADALADDRRSLRWRDDARYSARQRQETPLGGVVGRWTLRGDPLQLTTLLPWLTLGQWLHLGKAAVMGLGGYRLQGLRVAAEGAAKATAAVAESRPR